MTRESETAIPIDAYADPVAAYTVADDTPLVAATNDAFETAFEATSADTPLSTLFERFGVVETAGAGAPLDHLVRGDPVAVYRDGVGEADGYLARTVAAGDDGGFLVFLPLDGVLDLAETTGVEQVASVLGHDLRNPLDVATANLRAARETGADEHFDAVADAHDRMGTIIRDVLTLARGRDAVTPSEGTDIGNAVEDAWTTVDTDRASLDVRATLPAATADADRVRRLFENLFRNAVEHAADPVTVRVGPLDDGFYVADDGPGVPPDEREAVFDPGYSTTDGGTGLGLAIADRIVAAHGWDLRLTAARDGGARFEVRFRP
jgi:signal transduction histidine kinase